MLLTRAPLYKIAFDLHVLSMPPAFVLSQDQTLRLDVLTKQSLLSVCAQKFCSMSYIELHSIYDSSWIRYFGLLKLRRTASSTIRCPRIPSNYKLFNQRAFYKSLCFPHVCSGVLRCGEACYMPHLRKCQTLNSKK